ncbi:hypothetical protein FALCPG4_004573 [Fusarium falciforme]
MIRTDCEFHRAEEDGSFFHSPTKKAQFSGQKPLRGSIKLDNYPEEIAQQRQLLFSLQFPSQGYSRGEEQKLNTRGVLRGATCRHSTVVSPERVRETSGNRNACGGSLLLCRPSTAPPRLGGLGTLRLRIGGREESKWRRHQ